MATATPLSKDLKEIIIEVTGITPENIFNDKRVYFRRYKYTGLLNVSKKKRNKIRKKISKKYPDLQFVVQNHKKSTSKYCHNSIYRGLTVKVFE